MPASVQRRLLSSLRRGTIVSGESVMCFCSALLAISNYASRYGHFPCRDTKGEGF